jgi:hypothetical protein
MRSTVVGAAGPASVLTAKPEGLLALEKHRHVSTKRLPQCAEFRMIVPNDAARARTCYRRAGKNSRDK